MKYAATAFLFLGLILISCSPKSKFEKEIQVIDENLNTIDSVEEVVHSLQYDSLSYMVKTCKENLKQAQKYYTMDTIDQKFANELTYYKGIKKGVPSPHKLQHDWENEIEQLREQFKHLKHDVENGLLSEDKVKEYTKRESEDLKALLKEVEVFQKTYKSVADVFYQYNASIEQYIERLKKMNEQQTAG